jgi:hypothetical protein
MHARKHLARKPGGPMAGPIGPAPEIRKEHNGDERPWEV